MHPTAEEQAAIRFLHDNRRVITHCVRRFATRGDEDDFRQDLTLQILQRLHAYDPALSGPYTWIRFQARAVVTAHMRARRKVYRSKHAACMLAGYANRQQAADAPDAHGGTVRVAIEDHAIATGALPIWAPELPIVPEPTEPRDPERVAELAQALGRATRPQLEAAESVLLDQDRVQIRESLGISYQGRTNRLRKLGLQLTAAA